MLMVLLEPCVLSSVGSASCVDVLSLEAEGAVWAKTAVDADGNSGTVSVEVKALW